MSKKNEIATQEQIDAMFAKDDQATKAKLAEAGEHVKDGSEALAQQEAANAEWLITEEQAKQMFVDGVKAGLAAIELDRAAALAAITQSVGNDDPTVVNADGSLGVPLPDGEPKSEKQVNDEFTRRAVKGSVDG